MSEGRFATDSSLAWIARRLRLLGYDVAVHPGLTLPRVCEAARRESRIVLTLSRRAPPPCAWVERRVVRRDHELDDLRDLVLRWTPSGPPFSRCAHCNTPLVSSSGASGAEGLPAAGATPPPGVQVTGRCPTCGRLYWHGSHVDRLVEWFDSVLGRRVDPPASPGESGPPGPGVRGSRATS